MAFLPVVLGVSAVWAANQYAISWSTIDGGGRINSAGGIYSLSGTIGQPDAGVGPLSGGSYSLTGGFWAMPPCLPVQADFDGDCDVDSADLDVFTTCSSGPAVPLGSGCSGEDLDRDDDVDQADFAIFQRCYSGENVPADPTCAN